MKAQVLGHRVAGTIFGLVGLMHLLRPATGTNVVIGSWTMPVITSPGGALIPGALAVWLWKPSLPTRERPPAEGKA